jgi:hypothetical protein
MLSLLTACVLLATPPADASTYAIVVSEATYGDEQWREVVESLREKHGGSVILYKSSLESSLQRLRAEFPRYSCFVARPQEATREFVAAVHQLTGKLDADPYTDTLWGILTGFDAADALKIARHQKPLTVRKVASGTEIAMEMVEQGVWYCELKQHHMVEKKPSGAAELKAGPADTTQALVGTLNDYQADLFITSGHATERDWQIGFRYRNGSFRSEAGQLWGVDTKGKKYLIASPNPKVYLAVGNCLMGHIDGPDAMALAWMHSAGVHQMVGYTVPSWFGYGGWGLLDYFLEQPGRYTLTEAFQANHHALVYSLENDIGLERGLRFDREVVVLYGDPAWSARMADRPKAYEQELLEREGVFTLTIQGNRGEESFAPININGSQRGWRPIIELLPYRVENVEVLEDSGLAPVITDDFILVPNPRRYDTAKTYCIKFRADRVVRSTE